MIDLRLLNKEQKEAVLHIEGPCLVMAGAGSGKTRVLTTRIAHMIEQGINSHNILAITFTNKAATEMKDRIYGMVPECNAFIGTFHSFGLKIIRENLKNLGFNSNLTIIDSDDCLTIIKRIMKDLNIDSKEYSPFYIRNRISFIKNEMLDESEINKFMTSPPEKVAVSVYKKYQDILHNNNSVDFDDLLVLPVELLIKNPDILENYQEHYKYILVDEYQDTNAVQYKLSKLLAAKYSNIFVVGDIDQSIYGFRYANYQNILDFESDYKNTKVIILEENYRSTQSILNVANSIIKNNKERKEKNLWSNKDVGVKVKYYRCYDEKHEVTFVADEIKNLLNLGYDPSDMAVLYRTNAQVRIAEEVMLQNNIAYRVIGSYYFYNRKEIKDLICYLRMVLNPHDDISLQRVINEPKRGIGPTSIAKLQALASAKGISLFEAIDGGKEGDFKRIIEHLRMDYQDMSLSELIDEVIEISGMRVSLEKEHTLENELRLENIMEFKSIAASFENRTGSVNLEDFLEEITLVSDMASHQDNKQGVSLMTIHSAKGLEFKIVFLIGMEEGIFPHANSIMEGNLEEERRLCYVAVTRSMEKLYLTNARRRMLYGKDNMNPPSRFIDEIDIEYLDVIKEKNDKKENISIENYYSKGDVDLKKGDIINHDVYGKGVIIDIEDDLATIAFVNKVGIKKLLKNHKSIKKV